MSASQFVQYLTQALYLLISVIVIVTAARRPTRARIDIAIFFGAITLIFAESWVLRAFGVRAGPGLTALIQVLLMALPYLLVRLVSDFATVPPLILRGAELGLVLSVIAILAFQIDLPTVLVLLMVLYFFGLNVYVAVAFLRAARTSSGVTRRRMQA